MYQLISQKTFSCVDFPFNLHHTQTFTFLHDYINMYVYLEHKTQSSELARLTAHVSTHISDHVLLCRFPLQSAAYANIHLPSRLYTSECLPKTENPRVRTSRPHSPCINSYLRKRSPVSISPSICIIHKHSPSFTTI